MDLSRFSGNQTHERRIPYTINSLNDGDEFLKLNIKKRGNAKFTLENAVQHCYNSLVPISKEKKGPLRHVRSCSSSQRWNLFMKNYSLGEAQRSG